jgi:hypothetical protein
MCGRGEYRTLEKIFPGAGELTPRDDVHRLLYGKFREAEHMCFVAYMYTR